MPKLTKQLLRDLSKREIDEISNWNELDLEKELVILGLLIEKLNSMNWRSGLMARHSEYKEIMVLQEKQKEIVDELTRHKPEKELAKVKKSIAAKAAMSRKSIAPPSKPNNSAFFFGSNNDNDSNSINVKKIQWSNESSPTRAKKTKRRIRNVTKRLRHKPKHPIHR